MTDAQGESAAQPSAADAAAGPSGAATESTRPGQRDRRQRIVIITSIAVIAVLGIVLAFFLGSRLGAPSAPAPSPSRSSTPTPTPTPTPSPTPSAVVGPAAIGEHDWDQLGGGECLDPYVSPWERTFTVVDCAQPHPAQLVTRGSFGGDATTAYPGEPALVAQLNLLCSAPTVIDYGMAGGYPDVQLQASYPANEELWAAGDRDYFCFASLPPGGYFTSSIAVPKAG